METDKNEKNKTDDAEILLQPIGKVYRRPVKKVVDSEPGIINRFTKKASSFNLKGTGWEDDSTVIKILSELNKGIPFNSEIFTGLTFSGAVMNNPCMTGCDFTGSKFVATNMQHGNFNHSKFTDTDLTAANLFGADLSYCDFTGANLSGTNLENANLTGAKLDMVIFSEDTGFGGVIGEAKIQKNIDKIIELQAAAERGEIDLRSLGIVDLRKLDLRSINIKGVYLKDKDLKGKLSGVNLSGTMINDSDIMGADINMLHFWLRDMNEYNNEQDDKAAKKRQDYVSKCEKQNQEDMMHQAKQMQNQEEQEKLSLLSKNKSKMPKIKVRVKPTKGKIIF